MDASAQLAFDREHLWHPYTSMLDPAPTRLVTGASGSRISIEGAGDVVDGMASWWSAIHGYRHPVLDEALREQAERFSHVMFGGLTHEPAVELARRLVELTPDGLDRVFLADSGSVSVEVAMKMALQHQRGVGRPERTRFLTVRGGYHGDTFDCMSVCDPDGGMHSMWSTVLPDQVFGERPPGIGGDVAEWASGFRALAAEHAGGPPVAGQRADRCERPQAHRDVRVVLVRRVVHVEHLGPRGLEDRLHVGEHTGMAGLLHVAARVHQLDLAGVLADGGRFALLLHAHLDHLLVGVVGVDAGARAAAAVRHHDAREALVLLAEALGDAVERHELLVVLVRADAEVCRAPQRLRHRGAVGHEDVGVGA